MKIHFRLVCALVFSISLLASSCGKRDRESPVITINGSDESIQIKTVYEDQGATANDNKDGDITSSIVTSGSVDVNTAGAYVIEYTATDKKGNKGSAVRNVIVRHTGFSIAGSYSAKDSCGTDASQIKLYYDQTSGTNANRVLITRFANYPNTFIYFDISGPTGSVITVPSQTIVPGGQSISHVFSGSGTISSDGKKIVITYSDVTSTATRNCTLTYLRF